MLVTLDWFVGCEIRYSTTSNHVNHKNEVCNWYSSFLRLIFWRWKKKPKFARDDETSSGFRWGSCICFSRPLLSVPRPGVVARHGRLTHNPLRRVVNCSWVLVGSGLLLHSGRWIWYWRCSRIVFWRAICRRRSLRCYLLPVSCKSSSCHSVRVGAGCSDLVGHDLEFSGLGPSSNV